MIYVERSPRFYLVEKFNMLNRILYSIILPLSNEKKERREERKTEKTVSFIHRIFTECILILMLHSTYLKQIIEPYSL